MPDPPFDQWFARFQAAQPADHALRLANLEAQVTVLMAAQAASVQMINNLEVRMSATDDKVAELSSKLDTVSSNVTNVVGDVQGLQDEVQQLQDELAAQDPALAAKLQPLADKIQSLSDSTQALADSVPDAAPAPTPAPGDGTDVVNPTVDENGNPVV